MNLIIKKTLVLFVAILITGTTSGQNATVFKRIGSQQENVQDLFPGTHRARPILGDFTNNGFMDIFYGGQDVGGSSGWYLKYVNKDNRWGDQGDGTFINPVLNADYSDPDVIRVGDMYYMVCSDFHFMGMPVLESKDMVNWKIVSQIYNRLNFAEYENNQRYGGGSWAPSIRYHDGKFWVYFCTPNEGLFMANATNPHGPWSTLLNVKNIGGWEDPCPFWDENGQAYLGRSQLGAGPIILHKMSTDGTKLLDNGVKIYEGTIAEGTKIFKKNGFYYISIPEGGVSTGWQTVLRSKNIYGPYEKRVVLEQGKTKINGPHQGALVDTPEGQWWFYHFQSTDPLGRVVHLEPVTWTNDWPQIGVDLDGNGIGEPVKQFQKPIASTNTNIFAPQTDDDFSSTELELQWQFNHNPINSKWLLTERSGHLTIQALRADKLRDSRNMMTQKFMGYQGLVSTELDCSAFTNGQRAGLFCTGNTYNAIGVERVNGKNYIYVEFDGQSEVLNVINSNVVWFKATLEANNNEHQFYYSTDNVTYLPCKSPFELRSGDWKGARCGIFTYNKIEESGKAYFNWFKYEYDGPGKYSPKPKDPEPIKYADWNIWNEMAALVKNNGDGTFSLVQEYDANIAVTVWTNAVFFDYNNDGNLDLLVNGRGGDWRVPSDKKFVCLYKNLGANGNYLFEEVPNTGFVHSCDELYLNTISVGDYDNDGYNDVIIMGNDGVSGKVRLYKNNDGTGLFTLQPYFSDRAVSAGSVMFGDMDNDGWLDVFFCGSHENSTVTGIYKNMQDGTFSDIGSNYSITTGTNSQSILADINGDGNLDIITTGQSGFRNIASIYLNAVNQQSGKREFTLKSNISSGLVPVKFANILAADFNNDGLTDLILNGTSSTDNKTRVYYQNGGGTYSHDTNYPILSVHDGGINLGDINGDGNMDVIAGGYKSDSNNDIYNSPVRIYENHPELVGLRNNSNPESPKNIAVVNVGDGNMKISWESATDDKTPEKALRYNIFVKNDDTGETWMKVPAHITTGRVKVGNDLQILFSSQSKDYKMKVSQSGNYTIGVQSVDQSGAGSEFITVKKYIQTDNATIIAEKLQVINVSNGIMIKSSKDEEVKIINPIGKKVADGKTNSVIPLVSGLFIAIVNGASIKIIKGQ